MIHNIASATDKCLLTHNKFSMEFTFHYILSSKVSQYQKMLIKRFGEFRYENLATIGH